MTESGSGAASAIGQCGHIGVGHQRQGQHRGQQESMQVWFFDIHVSGPRLNFGAAIFWLRRVKRR